MRRAALRDSGAAAGIHHGGGGRTAADDVLQEMLLFGLMAMTFAFWIAMMLAKDDHTGLPYGFAAVIASVFVAGMIAARVSQDNTRAILKAIDLLSMEK